MDSQLESCLAALSAKFGPKLSISQGDLKPYSKDNSYHTQRFPTAVISPTSEFEVSQILSICNTHRIPVIPFAAGSSLEGHIIPDKHSLSRGCITLDVSQMDKIIQINPNDLSCVVEPGVNWIDLRRELEPYRLFFPPDPGAAACIGGMCGTNCSGSLAYKYGTMKDNVLGLRVVMADGTIITTRRNVTKSSAGYDLTRLIVGSEGTLGIVTRAILKLRRYSEYVSVALVQFKTLKETCVYINHLVVSGPESIHRIELMDDYCIQSTNNAISGFSLPVQFTVLIEFCGNTTEYIESSSKICEDVAIKDGCTMYKSAASEIKECEKLWSIRKKALFAAKSLYPTKSPTVSTLVTDVAVPISKIGEILEYTRQLIEDYRLTASIVAHAGDGNFHALMLCDRENKDEVARVEKVRDLMAIRAIELQGTCTGEHGVGKGKIDLLVRELGEETVDVMRRVKKALDPNWILNPGKVFVEKPKL